MRSLFRFLRDRRFSYEPLVEVRVSKDALLHNLRVFKDALPGQNIAPVLKANAYGHGLIEVARILEGQSGVSFFVVDSYYEALVLRNENIHTPILVIGHTLTKNILESALPSVSFAVGSLSQLRELAEQGVRQPLHIKIDTGMHRQGIMKHELDETFKLITNNRQLSIEGVCSHFSDADNSDETFTREQIRTWNECVQTWRTRVPDTKYFHISATPGARFAKDIDANVGRLGIGLYGVASTEGLHLALSMYTRVTAMRAVKKGETVGYSKTWIAERETVVATIPVGYYEGVDRRLSNKGFVRVHGKECPIIGRVSMNMTTVDVTGVLDVKEGDGVEVISTKPGARNSIQYMADLCDTIPYVLLVHIPGALRRVVE